MRAGILRLAGAAAVCVIALSGCDSSAVRTAERPPVDSALSRGLAMAQFRATTDSAVTLSGGVSSQHELAVAWVAAVAESDTAALRRMVLNAAEFAWLFYPSTPQGLPPYDLSPALMWEMLARQTNAGMDYVLRKTGGRPLELAAFNCGDKPDVEGENLIWGPCVMTVVRGTGDTLVARLTGPVIERHGMLKFVSYTNDLD